MPISKTNTPAQTALGKFYLHPWDSQVLVDWAKSLVLQGKTDEELVALSGMERSSREAILDQFGTVVLVNNIDVSFDEHTAATDYLNDLRTRVLADKIDSEAAFAQVRPLAYDLDGIQLTGLSELDEDLNLVDSGVAPFHHDNLNATNKNVFIRRFFSEMRILEPLPTSGDTGRQRYDYELDTFSEGVSNVVLAVLSFLILLSLLSGAAV
ncbi:MAG: hypothetical protein ACI974_002204 [Paraglaciecola sp.]|jgi:hypothetical protein